MINMTKICKIDFENKRNKSKLLSARNMKKIKILGGSRVGRGGVGRYGYLFNWPK